MMTNIFQNNVLVDGVQIMKYDYSPPWDGKTCAPLVAVKTTDPISYVRGVSGYALALLPDGMLWTVDNDGTLMYGLTGGQRACVPAVADVLRRINVTDESQGEAVIALGGQP